MSRLFLPRQWPVESSATRTATTAPADSTSRGVRWLAGLRVVLALAVLGPLATLAVGDGDLPRASWLLALLAVPVAASATALATVRRASSRLLVAQIALDAAVVLLVMWATGGVDSQLAPLLILPVLAASVMQGRRAGLHVALGVAGGIAVLFALQHGAFGHAAWVSAPLAGPRRPAGTVALYALAIQIAGVVSVALLVGHLAESLSRKSADLDRAHTDLADLTSLSQRVIDSMAGGVAAADADGRVVLFNRTAVAITGLSSASVLGRRLVDVLHLPAGWQVGLTQGMPTRFEFRFTKADGLGLELGATVAPLVSDSGLVAGELLTFQDLTLIKQREREQQRQARLAAVGEMAAGIAHEIRNPLASMSGSIQLLQRELSLRDEQAVLLDIVLRESQRLNQTIKDFLTYAGPQRVTRATIDVRPLVRETVELLTKGGTIGSAHQVEAHLPETPVYHDVDGAQMRQVLWNLATNALKAMPEGGRLRLAAAPVDEPGQREPTLEIVVEDEGIGIDAQHVERMFQPFQGGFRHGTGLGLSIVHRIVSDHGGTVKLESRSGEGTRVVVRIPWATGIAAGGRP